MTLASADVCRRERLQFRTQWQVLWKGSVLSLRHYFIFSFTISPFHDCFLLISAIKFELWHQEDLSKPVVEHWMKVHVFGNVPYLLSQSMGCEEPLKMVLRSMVPTQSSSLKGIVMWMIACCLYHIEQKWSTYFNAHKPHLQSRTSAYTSPLTQVTAWHELSSSFPTRGLCIVRQWICYSGRSLRRHSPTQQWLILNPLLDKSALLSTVFLNQLHKRSLVLFQTQRPCKAAPVWLWDQLYRSVQGARVFTFSATMTEVDSAMQKPSGWGPSSPLRKASHSQLLADGHGDCGIP